jgi:hypothetical protein
VLSHADGQRLQPAREQIAVERRELCAEPDLLVELDGFGGVSIQTIAVPSSTATRWSSGSRTASAAVAMAAVPEPNA